MEKIVVDFRLSDIRRAISTTRWSFLSGELKNFEVFNFF